MIPREDPGLRPHRSRLAAMSACGLVAGSLALALLPLAAFANTGSVTATEDCQTWSAKVDLDNNVASDHLVDVVLTPEFPQTGFVGKSFDTTGAKGQTTIWKSTGSAPLTGTVTLIIHYPNGSVESTQSQSIHQTNCHPAITTTLSHGSITVPGTVHDSATLTGASATAGGTVEYKVYTDIACSLGAKSAGIKTVTNGKVPDSDSLTFTSAATVHWQAAYSGDANNSPAMSACSEETLVINKAADTVATQATPATGVVGTSGTFGDTATISSADQPSGNISFGLYSDAACTSAVNGVAGNGAIRNGTASFSITWTPSAAGTYYWKTSYAGDANNTGFTECGGANEVVTVTGAPAGGTQGTNAGGAGAGGTQGTNAGSVLGAAAAAPALPKAGHPSVELAPASASGNLIRTMSLVFALASLVVLAAGMISSRARKTQE